MGDAYTPGLTVTGNTVVRKVRRLPLAGTVLCKVGQRVASSDVVARTELPGRVHLINFANVLGCLPDELGEKLRVEVGSQIRRGQILASSSSFFGLFKRNIASPIDGSLESVSSVTGQAVLREPPNPVEVDAYIDGVVVEELPREGVVVESRAALVQGIFGLSGAVTGELLVVAKSPDAVLDAGDLKAEHAGKVLVGGSRVTLDGMRRAIELEIAAVVVGGFAYHDIRDLLGYDIGVAVTGTESLGTTLVVTEGFGEIAMAGATYELLSAHAGKKVSVTGATQIRAGVIRPEVVICHDGGDHGGAAADGASGLAVGAPVRCIRAPFFGRIGRVSELPVDLEKMDSETLVRVLEIEFEGGGSARVPRANVEVIER